MLILNPEFLILEWSSQKVCSVFKNYVPFRTVSYCICCEILLFLPSFSGACSSECHPFLIFLISCSASPCCALLPEYVLFISCLRERWIENRLSIQVIVIGWPHQASCPLCNGPPETGHHLCLLCPFVQMVWLQLQVSTWEYFMIPRHAVPTNFDSIKDWWEAAAISVHKSQRRKFNGIAIYIMWNLWKERNRRVFENKHCIMTQVAELFPVFWWGLIGERFVC